MSRYCIQRLNKIEGYTPGEQPKNSDVIKLNTNENPFTPPIEILQALKEISSEQLRKYPDPLALELRQKIACIYDIPGAEWVIAGNGMDEILSILIRTFVDYHETISATYPTYSLYEVLADLHGCKFQYHDLDENFNITPPFTWNSSKLLLITHPNAPSGVPTPPEVMKDICRNQEQVIFIDEAYVDFCDFSYISWVKNYPNVIVGRTFSKSFSLAGVRLGFAVGNPELISDMFKVKDSYNINVLTQKIGIRALENYNQVTNHIETIKTTRSFLQKELQKLGFIVPNSQSNFLLAIWNGTPSAKDIYLKLKEKNIFVRYFPMRRLENALRITIGTKEQCAILLENLVKIIH
ncbi:MAG: histidinol-phosphate transaminase [Candidatus Hydrogenedens sp.]